MKFDAAVRVPLCEEHINLKPRPSQYICTETQDEYQQELPCKAHVGGKLCGEWTTSYAIVRVILHGDRIEKAVQS